MKLKRRNQCFDLQRLVWFGLVGWLLLSPSAMLRISLRSFGGTDNYYNTIRRQHWHLVRWQRMP